MLIDVLKSNKIFNSNIEIKNSIDLLNQYKVKLKV